MHPKDTAIQQFLTRVDVTSGLCWLWTGAIAPNGYGKVWFNGRQVGAHRVAYMLFVGSIPPGKQLDHLCRVRHCVNPSHLEPVTQRENILRGATLAAQNMQRTECRSGHPLVVEKSGIGRFCPICRRMNSNASAARRGPRVRKTAPRICIVCGVEFNAPLCAIKVGGGLCCSRTCAAVRGGRRTSELAKARAN